MLALFINIRTADSDFELDLDFQHMATVVDLTRSMHKPSPTICDK